MTQLLLAISVFGLVLVGLLYARLRAVDRTLQLKRHRSTEEGLCDLLNYAAVVGDGIVIGKNGALIAINDNWATDPNADQVRAAGLAPSNPHEAALARTLTPDFYTAIVRGANNTTGIGVVEAYVPYEEVAISVQTDVK